ncbi:MAG: 23S rRNA (guanosine(2251)-2'-O)-methyltransferase RlmB [Bacteroidales bacterium]|nr:23S rRNA (guanosine(2251)-2'-O)-methyltransferase RlmB [Bacteroidales bacterium]
MKLNTPFIYGTRPLFEAIDAGRQIDRVLIKNTLRENLEELLTLLRKHNIPYQFVQADRLNRITRHNHQGVIAFVSEIEYYDLEKIIPILFEEGKVPLVLALDHITDVRNFGAIARSAECAGAHALLIAEKGHAGVNADAIKTSAGALHHISVCRVKSLHSAFTYLKESGLQIIAATEKAEKIYTSVDFNLPSVIVLGAEDTGITRDLLRMADHLVRIPMLGKTASLNVSVAAGILLYEAVRQRNPKVRI